MSYLHRVKTPTLLVQGQADTLFNLNEATATYRTLKAQGTPVKMIWQSWGHSGGLTGPAAGELDLSQGNLETSYVGRRVLAWFDRHLRGRTHVDTGPAFAYYRDWITDPDRTYATAGRLPALEPHAVPLRRRQARRQPQQGGPRQPRLHQLAAPHQPLRELTRRPHRSAGHAAARHQGHLPRLDQRAARARPLDVVGAPRATLKVHSPKAERTQNSGDAADKLVLFAKLYDVAPDGTRTLVRRLVAPVRVPGRHQELHRHPARDRAPVRDGAPAAVRDRGE